MRDHSCVTHVMPCCSATQLVRKRHYHPRQPHGHSLLSTHPGQRADILGGDLTYLLTATAAGGQERIKTDNIYVGVGGWGGLVGERVVGVGGKGGWGKELNEGIGAAWVFARRVLWEVPCHRLWQQGLDVPPTHLTMCKFILSLFCPTS
jgi:hypothetical protein